MKRHSFPVDVNLGCSNPNQDVVDRIRKMQRNINAEIDNCAGELEMILCAPQEKNDAPLHVRQTYELVIDDHFRGQSIDSATWATRMRWGPSLTINNEEQYYVDTQQPNICPSCPDPFQLDGEILSIDATYAGANQAPATNAGELGGQNYYSGVITSKQDFLYGYFEICARVPKNIQGSWAAFWLYHASRDDVGDNGKFGTEIDIGEWVEGLGSAQWGGGPYSGDCHKIAYHFDEAACSLDGSGFQCGGQNAITQDCIGNVYDQNNGLPETCDPSFSDNYHTYGVDWCPDQLTFYRDGEVIATICDATIISQVPMYVIANLAVGGNFPGPASPADFPAKFEIDYIRAYQK